MHAGQVAGGSLAVTNSSQILPVVQEWIDYFDAHGLASSSFPESRVATPAPLPACNYAGHMAHTP